MSKYLISEQQYALLRAAEHGTATVARNSLEHFRLRRLYDRGLVRVDALPRGGDVEYYLTPEGRKELCSAS